MAIPIQPVLIGGRWVRSVQAITSKLAANPTESSYEPTLAKLGLSVLQDRLSQLMPYFRGFQLLELSEDGEFAAGFFVFEPPGAIFDVPMFLIKGALKGKELLFLRSKQVFIPSHDVLIRYLLSLGDQGVGKPGPAQNDSRANRATPNIDVFSRANQFMYKVSSLSEWGQAAGVRDSFNMIYGGPTPLILTKLANKQPLGSRAKLVELLQLPGVAEKLSSWCDQSPKLAQQAQQRLGDWKSTVLANRYAAATSFVGEKQAMLSAASCRFPGFLPAAADVPYLACSQKVAAFATEASRAVQAAEIARYGMTFTDRRPAGHTKYAMDVQEAGVEFGCPQATTWTKVPCWSGSSRKVIVILPQNRLDVDRRSLSRGEAIVVDPSSGEAVEIPPAELAASQAESSEVDIESSDWMSAFKAIDRDVISEGKLFLLVDSYDRVVGPFVSEGACASGGTSVNACRLTSVGDHFSASTNRNSDAPYAIETIQRVEGGRGYEVSRTGDDGDKGVLLVSPDVRILYLTPEREDDYCRMAAGIDVIPMSRMTLEAFQKKADFRLMVSNPDFCSLNGEHMRVRDAAVMLMEKFGLSKHASLGVLEDRSDKLRYYAAIPDGQKVAAWQLQTKVADVIRESDVPRYQFNFPDQPTGMASDTVIPVEESYPIRALETAMMEYADRSSPEWSGQRAPYEQPMVMGGSTRSSQDKDAINAVTEAKDSLWENKLFSSLLRSVRIESQIQKQVSQLFQMANETGRTLYFLWAHQAEFIDVFGEKDVPKLEEQLISLQEACGEIIADHLQQGVSEASDGILMSIESM